MEDHTKIQQEEFIGDGTEYIGSKLLDRITSRFKFTNDQNDRTLNVSDLTKLKKSTKICISTQLQTTNVLNLGCSV